MTKIDASVLDTIWNACSNRPSIIYGNRTFTYKELGERITQLAYGYLDIGLKKDDKVMVGMRNCNEHFEAYFAGLRAGIIPTNLNFYYTGKEAAYILNNVDAKALIIDEDFIDNIETIISETKVEHVIVRRTGLDRELPNGWSEYEEFISKYPKSNLEVPWELPPLSDPNTIIFIQNTTGTTGLPKPVLLPVGVLTGFLEEAGAYVAPLLSDIAPIMGDLGIGSMIGVPFLDKLLKGKLVQIVVSQRATGDLIAKLLEMIVPMILKMDMEAIKGPFYLLEHLLGTVLIHVPLGHIQYGVPTVVAYFSSFLGQCNVLVKTKHFDPVLYWRTIEKVKANVLTTPGETVTRRMADVGKEGDYDTSSIRLIASGGSPITGATRKDILDICPNAVYLDWYGSTEAIMGLFMLYTRENADAPTMFKKPYFLSVLDENDNPIIGKEGELAQSAGTLSLGYYKMPEATGKKHILVKGKKWLRLGDMAIEDEDGYITLVGRGSECINTGGFKVWPVEVEEVLKKNPKIEECIICGIPDKEWGEAVTAIIKSREGERSTEKEMIDWCKDKIAGFKKPKYILFTDERAEEVISIEKKKSGLKSMEAGWTEPWRYKMRDWAMEKLGIKEE